MSIAMATRMPRVETRSRSWLGLPLRTLNQPAFASACAALMRMVEVDYAPTLIVGIRTGGLIVAETMVESRIAPVPVLPLTCQRASTGAKTKLPFVRATLARLPRPVADVLRRLEHRWLTAPGSKHEQPRRFDAAEGEVITAWLRRSPITARVLVVDDAVDSGATLATVLQFLRDAGSPGMELRSAVITQTCEQPRVRADYALHRNVLFRFPWSLDA